eukprot:Phypoly_transcript_10411.p1 GENE.Phypoly_transcript_10411~~Phypoly_transcript_10411.p1  ORF type:complete len:233 (+),score=12.61 Phypoly_transcript_10411:414-1112(+)
MFAYRVSCAQSWFLPLCSHPIPTKQKLKIQKKHNKKKLENNHKNKCKRLCLQQSYSTSRNETKQTKQNKTKTKTNSYCPPSQRPSYTFHGPQSSSLSLLPRSCRYLSNYKNYLKGYEVWDGIKSCLILFLRVNLLYFLSQKTKEKKKKKRTYLPPQFMHMRTSPDSVAYVGSGCSSAMGMQSFVVLQSCLRAFCIAEALSECASGISSKIGRREYETGKGSFVAPVCHFARF